MPRKPRFAPAGYFLHLTQRGNYRQRTFFTPQDHDTFQRILAHHADAHEVDVLAFCQMSNHYHLIARSNRVGGISRFMQGMNGNYSQYLNGRLARRGRLWQERFFSSVLSTPHLITAMRYVELNPVRSGIVGDAAAYPWSSARVHTGNNGKDEVPPVWLDQKTFLDLYSIEEWKEYLDAGQSRAERAAIRLALLSERPLGDAGFLEQLQAQFPDAFPDRQSKRSARRPPQAKAATFPAAAAGAA